MNHRFRGLLAIGLVSGVVIAGCGGGGGSSTTSSTTPAAANTTTSTSRTTSASKTSTSTTSTSTTVASTSKTTSAVTPSSPQVAAVVSACKASIAGAPSLSSSEKTQLDAACEKAAHGDVAGARAAAAQVCKDVVKSSGLSGATATAAEHACSAISSGTGTGSTTPSIPSTGGGGLNAAVLKAECSSISQLEAVAPSSVKSAITAVCQKVAHGDISGAKSELKQVCESVVKLVPQAEQSVVSAECAKL